MRLLIGLLFCSIAAAAQPLNEVVRLHAKDMDQSLAFLDTMLRDKRIVMLGESSHGTEEYSDTKFRLIRYLHEKLGYNVLLFESPMAGGVQPFWRTVTIDSLLSYVRDSKMSFAGFDPQWAKSSFEVFSYYPEIRNKLLALDDKMNDPLEHARAYAAIAKELDGLPLTPQQQWARQMVNISAHYYSRINEGDERDSCMAKNIIWLAEHLYQNEKIIVWAHNTHINKAPSNNRIMGKLLAAHFGRKLYGIGLYMTNGTTVLNNRKVITVKAPPKGSMEKLLGARGFKSAFIETSYPAFDTRIPTLHWGKEKQLLNLSKSFDAIILINGVHSPVYAQQGYHQ